MSSSEDFARWVGSMRGCRDAAGLILSRRYTPDGLYQDLEDPDWLAWALVAAGADDIDVHVALLAACRLAIQDEDQTVQAGAQEIFDFCRAHYRGDDPLISPFSPFADPTVAAALIPHPVSFVLKTLLSYERQRRSRVVPPSYLAQTAGRVVLSVMECMDGGVPTKTTKAVVLAAMRAALPSSVDVLALLEAAIHTANR